MRKPRQLEPGARYHVTARINHQEMLLNESATKDLFLRIVRRAKNKYAFKIENFTIIDNHFHLIIQPIEAENLSRIMQWIMGVFTMAYNRMHNLKGHLWQGRFFSRIIRTFRNLLEIFDYIDGNPIKAGLAPNKWDWAYCGISHHRAGRHDIVEPVCRCVALLAPIHQILQLANSGIS